MTLADEDDILGQVKPRPQPIADLIGEVELADLFGITTRRVRELRTDGTIPAAGRATYSRREACRSYTAHLRNLRSGRSSGDAELKAEKLRFERERADKLAASNAAARRELLPAAEVVRTWATTLRAVRAAMLAIPSRVGARLSHLTQHDLSELDREIRDALAESADAAS